MSDHESSTPNPGSEAKNKSGGNLRLVAVTVLLLLGVTLVSTYLIGKSESFKPDYMARVFLFGFTLVIWALLLVLGFVLGRNLIKLFLERKNSARGAKFKTKLVIIFIGFSLVPSALIVLVGSRLISTSVDRWFSHPVEEVLVGAQDVVEHYFQEKHESAMFYARSLSREIGESRLLSPERLSRLSRTMNDRLMLRETSKENRTIVKRNADNQKSRS